MRLVLWFSPACSVPPDAVKVLTSDAAMMNKQVGYLDGMR
jgi:hypothetical protein